MSRSVFRSGHGPHEDDWSGLVRQAKWSDAFFNYVPAEQNSEDEAVLAEVAKEFLEVHEAECPYTAEWLVAEFGRRV